MLCCFHKGKEMLLLNTIKLYYDLGVYNFFPFKHSSASYQIQSWGCIKQLSNAEGKNSFYF